MRTIRREMPSNLETADLATALHTEIESYSTTTCRQVNAGQVGDRDATELNLVEAQNLARRLPRNKDNKENKGTNSSSYDGAHAGAPGDCVASTPVLSRPDHRFFF